ncbi:hypothetical protein EV44_g3578 [Erysiphe necator]|uniref:Uncharacterized protein n=1 Tax=Uncinula necator TaxID=52586 RepID=A0A0B1NYH9_UNCNE|nr:hypothetical protein EV44_g3578 [Erysiphe necator]
MLISIGYSSVLNLYLNCLTPSTLTLDSYPSPTFVQSLEENFGYVPAPNLPQFHEARETNLSSSSSSSASKLFSEASQIIKTEKIEERISNWVNYKKLVSDPPETSGVVEMSDTKISSQGPVYLDYLPKFKIEKFHGNGSQDARRWLMDLKAEFRDHYLKVPASPNLWVEALFRETDEEAARWIDSTPHIRRIVDNYEVATASDSAYLEQSLKEKFPMVVVVESSKSASEVITEFAQFKSESLFDYYGRAVAFLRLKNVNDRLNDDTRETLSGAEDMVLDMLIKAFVAGLEEDSLHLDSIAHGATTTGSLAKTYDIVLESRRALDEIQK